MYLVQLRIACWASACAATTRAASQFYAPISALRKSVRGSDPGCRRFTGWCACSTAAPIPATWRGRIVRMATEDVGLADPRACGMALERAPTSTSAWAARRANWPWPNAVSIWPWRLSPTRCTSPFNAARALRVKKDGTRPVPMHLRNAPTKLMKEPRLRRRATATPTTRRAALPQASGILPDGMEAPGLLSRPVERGLEQSPIAEKMRTSAGTDRDNIEAG